MVPVGPIDGSTDNGTRRQAVTSDLRALDTGGQAGLYSTTQAAYTAARNHYAWAVTRFPLRRYGRRQMHGKTYWSEDSLSMVDQTHKLPEIRSSAQIDSPLQSGVVVLRVSYLHEENPSPEVIYYLLVSFDVPPFDREVGFASRRDQPERPPPAG